jgi:hypothetical protein
VLWLSDKFLFRAVSWKKREGLIVASYFSCREITL